jgi:hypothetical protein
MSITRVKTANFGKTKSGLANVGFTVFNSTGIEAASRSTLGVYEVGILTGIYSAPVTFSDNFSGTILWDTGEAPEPTFASEEINLSDSAGSLSGDITDIKSAISSDLTLVRDMIAGRWSIDHENFQMIFYKEDNATEVARFDLRDKNDKPSYLSVFNRHKAT